MNVERIPQEEIENNPEAWRAFVKEMGDRQYGPPETRSAWLWFFDGFRAGAQSMANGEDPE